jgi:hypothetical protein
MITQNEISLARRESSRKALISLVMATFHPAEPRRYCCISRSAMMPPGALTARLSGVPWKPARQIAATENLYGRALNGRILKSRDSTAVPSAPISETPVQCRRKLASDFRLRYVLDCEDGGFQ